MMLNEKLNYDAQKIMWTKAVHTLESVKNSMAATFSTTSPFENIYGEKPNIVGLFLEFGHISYVTKQDKFKKQITNKTLKAIIVGYEGNHTRDMYKLCNPETNY